MLEKKKKKKNTLPKTRVRKKWLKTDAFAIFFGTTAGAYYLMRDVGFLLADGLLIYLLLGVLLGITARYDKPLVGMLILGTAFGAAFTVHSEDIGIAGVYGFALIGVLIATGFFVSEQLSHRR